MLSQHYASQQVRPGHCAERQLDIGARKNAGIETLGTADHKADPACALNPTSQQCGKLFAIRLDTAEVECDHPIGRLQSGQDGVRFPDSDFSRASTSVGKLGHDETRVDAICILRKQPRFRPLPDPTDRQQP